MRSAVLVSGLVGLASGLVILGFGGRLLMRLLALTTPEAPRFTWSGTLEIVGIAAAWGAVTGPLVLLTRLRRVVVDALRATALERFRASADGISRIP